MASSMILDFIRSFIMDSRQETKRPGVYEDPPLRESHAYFQGTGVHMYSLSSVLQPCLRASD